MSFHSGHFFLNQMNPQTFLLILTSSPSPSTSHLSPHAQPSVSIRRQGHKEALVLRSLGIICQFAQQRSEPALRPTRWHTSDHENNCWFKRRWQAGPLVYIQVRPPASDLIPRRAFLARLSFSPQNAFFFFSLFFLFFSQN